MCEKYTKSPLSSFPFSNGLGTSLSPPCVKNVVTGNERTWFLYSKWRILTQHIQKFLHVWPGPFPDFWAGSGNEASQECRHSPTTLFYFYTRDQLEFMVHHLCVNHLQNSVWLFFTAEASLLQFLDGQNTYMFIVARPYVKCCFVLWCVLGLQSLLLMALVPCR